MPLQYFKGVGPSRASLLARAGYRTSEDLVLTLPRDWQDRRWRYNLRESPIGERVAVRGIVRDFQLRSLRSTLTMAQARLEDGHGALQAVWFKKTTPRYDVFAPLKSKIRAGVPLAVFGVVDWGLAGRQIAVEDYALLGPQQTLAPEDDPHFGRIVPVYSVPEGLTDKLIRSLVARALPLISNRLGDPVPPDLLDATAFSKIRALNQIHFPDNWAAKEQARERLAFEEFLILETALALLRRSIERERKPHLYTLHRHLLTPFKSALGFTLTDAQKRVIRDLFEDLQRPYPMNRLLQGDVGSGKTVVALCAMLLAVENGGQAALMAPTEILADQHARTIRSLLGTLPVRTALLTGRQSATDRRAVLTAIDRGEVQLVIGTHALIQKSVTFSRLMLAVIDEQHRFGVDHRRLLREKGACPDVLVMTATPIPRTLALTVYGDLDVSIIDQLPPGRTPVVTRHVPEADACRRVREVALAGGQAYIVYPLVEESDKLELKAAVREAEVLRRGAFKDLSVGVLHGQMKTRDQEDVLSKFRQGALQVLMTTSIIEVGIDVPRATLMVIEHAERFGLATLHQLRGRVGRGAAVSECLLVADTKTDDARRRIAIMVDTTDGFRISEEDLSMRGPGEVLGVQQHGIPEFRAGNLVRDAALISRARQAAGQILKEDPTLQSAGHRRLAEEVQRVYGGRWALGATS